MTNAPVAGNSRPAAAGRKLAYPCNLRAGDRQFAHSVRVLTSFGFGGTMPCGKMLRSAVRLPPDYTGIGNV
jgi:hypothetical protein